MNAAIRRLTLGLMAGALLATSSSFLPESAQAKPIDDGYAQTCLSISRRVAEVVEDYNNQWASPGTDPDPRFLAEYRELVRQWYANGCDKTFGSLPRLNPPPKIDAANQAASPGGQVLAPTK